MRRRPPIDGVAGADARAQAERLKERRLVAASGRSPAVRVLRMLVGPSPAQQRLARCQPRWAAGPRGEELLARALAQRCPGVPFLHDRRLPGSPAAIDHLAFAPSGVYVIDTERCRGPISVGRAPSGQQRLLIDGRDRTRLISGLERRLAAVRGALAEIDGTVPVEGCLCFVAPEGLFAEVGLPAFRTLRVCGHRLYCSRRLARRLNRPGPLDPARARALQAALARRLPPAPGP